MFPWTCPSAHAPPPGGNHQLPLVPSSLARHPHSWTKQEVTIWLEWCAEEFAIEPVCPETFDMNGKALDLLTRKDFIDRDPKSGDLLFNALQRLLAKHDATPSITVPCHFQAYSPAHPLSTCHINQSPPQIAPVSTHRQNGILLVTTQSPTTANSSCVKPISPYVSILPGPDPISNCPTERMCTPGVSMALPGNCVLTPPSTHLDSDSTVSDSESTKNGQSIEEVAAHYECEDAADASVGEVEPGPVNHVTSNMHKEDGDCRLLWEFIHQLLLDSRYRNLVVWENEMELIFRIVHPTGLAGLWGQQKNRTNMTYEKLSRALRYYYKMSIIKKVPGKRLTYKFLQHPKTIKKGQRGARPHSIRRNVDLKLEQYVGDDRVNLHVPMETQPLAHSNAAVTDNEGFHWNSKHLAMNPRESFDQACDIQFINGRLTNVNSTIKQEVNHDSSDDIKREVPEQVDPVDLSMNSFSRRKDFCVVRTPPHTLEIDSNLYNRPFHELVTKREAFS